MNRSIAFIGGGVIIALLVTLAACATFGSRGRPWGITNFPTPQSFTTEYNNSPNLPNPFVSWHGNTVTAENWDLRRAELGQILEHYMLGYKHPDEGMTSIIEAVGTGGEEQLITFRVTRDDTGASGIFYAKVAIPSGPVPADGWPVIMTVSTGAGNPDNLGAPSVNNAYINANGFVHMNAFMGGVAGRDISGMGYRDDWVNANIDTGLVTTLFPDTSYWTGNMRPGEYDTVFERWDDTRQPWMDDYGDLDSPGLMMNWVWGISRLIDALEAENAKPAAERKIHLNPEKIAITGASRNGKMALFAGAFEPRISVVSPADTCGAGFNIDRFVSIMVNEADSRRNFPTPYWAPGTSVDHPSRGSYHNWPPYNMSKTEGFGPFDGYGNINKLYQYFKYEGTGTDGVIFARKVTAAEALIDPTRNLDGGVTKPFPGGPSQNIRNHVLWKGVPAGINTPEESVDNNATNLKDGYGVHWHVFRMDDGERRPYGPQTLLDHLWGFPNYWGTRMQMFPLLYADMGLHGREDRGMWGYLPNAPFDAHFITSMIAPRPLLMVGGYVSENANSEGAFLTYLATREVYSMLGAEDNLGISITVHHHTQTTQNYVDLVDLCVAYWNDGGVMSKRLRPSSVNEYPFPINDPRSRYDYLKLDWAAPGNTSIADQVRALVPANATSWSQIGGIPNN